MLKEVKNFKSYVWRSQKKNHNEIIYSNIKRQNKPRKNPNSKQNKKSRIWTKNEKDKT